MSEQPTPVPSGSHGPPLQPLSRLARGGLYTALALLVLALLFGGWGAWTVFRTASSEQPTLAQLHAQQRKIDDLEQRAATLARSPLGLRASATPSPPTRGRPPPPRLTGAHPVL